MFKRLHKPGANINAQLRVRGIYLTELAKHFHLAPSYICRILSGEKKPARWQKAIADLAGMSPFDLFGELCHPELKTDQTHDQRDAS